MHYKRFKAIFFLSVCAWQQQKKNKMHMRQKKINHKTFFKCSALNFDWYINKNMYLFSLSIHNNYSSSIPCFIRFIALKSIVAFMLCCLCMCMYVFWRYNAYLFNLLKKNVFCFVIFF